MLALVNFVRQGDVARVRELIQSKDTDVNAISPVTVRYVDPKGGPTPYTPQEEEVGAALLYYAAWVHFYAIRIVSLDPLRRRV